ncbi:MAG: hypothetical protein ABSE45_04445 [Candidatus Acidiferrales bacterium]|jgi:hypothetical protein
MHQLDESTFAALGQAEDARGATESMVDTGGVAAVSFLILSGK